jgi:hypothetical protein
MVTQSGKPDEGGTSRTRPNDKDPPVPVVQEAATDPPGSLPHRRERQPLSLSRHA